MSVKLVITIPKNWMKVEHVQLFYNLMDEVKIVKFFKTHYPGYKQKIIQFIRRNQVDFSSSNVSTDTTVIVKDYMLSEKFTFCFKITIKWNLTKSHATRLK